MLESDPAQLNQVFRLQPDRQPALIDGLVAKISDPQAGNGHAVLVGVKRTDRLAENLADTIAAVGPRGHIGADPVMTGIEADGVV